jgi:hypothetical protein
MRTDRAWPSRADTSAGESSGGEEGGGEKRRGEKKDGEGGDPGTFGEDRGDSSAEFGVSGLTGVRPGERGIVDALGSRRPAPAAAAA